MTREDIIRMAQDAWVLPDAHIPNVLEFASLVAAATLKNSVMTDEEYEQAMPDEGQRIRLTFDAEVIEMVKEAVGMEREACAKVAEQIEREVFNAVGDPRVSEFKPKIAAAIRARGQV